MLRGRCLVAQSGGPTAVINSSAFGVIREAVETECITGVYGAENGILGILNDQLFDIEKEKPEVIEGLRYTPSSALGTCRHKLTSEAEYRKVLSVFKKHDIRFFFYIGGNDSQDTANKLSNIAKVCGYEVRVIGVPKTVDNDLVGIDHCPGYGSAIKYLATMLREVALDTEASCSVDKVNIIETMGRNAGWIAAGTILARETRDQAPDIILLPEVPFSRESFIKKVRYLIKKQNRCVVVASEGLKNPDGSYLTESKSAVSIDTFGHRQLGGVAATLKKIVEEELSLKTRYCRPSIINRNGSHFSSKVDSNEAYELGRQAVVSAVRGLSGMMVTLNRLSDDPYRCEISTIPLEKVANFEKLFPQKWITNDGMNVNDDFISYALPLIQGEVNVPIVKGLPSFVRLAKIKVAD